MLIFFRLDEMLRVLLRDHDLIVHEQREKNLNRFMAHIGQSSSSLLETDDP